MGVIFLDARDFLKESESSAILDVRSPVEYAQGHIPGALNLPLFSDEERAEVGICYKNKGFLKAFLLGLRFVGPKLPHMVEKAWELSGQSKKIYLYCARGGQRSQSVAWLFAKSGLEVFVLKGGYKFFRRFVLELLEKKRKLLILGGLTGSGKTELLHQLASRGWPVLDLEGLANHRGSAFGHLGLPPQPTVMQFENNLALALVKLPEDEPIFVEDESRMIGRLPIPKALWEEMRRSPVFFLRVDRETRIKNILAQYGASKAQELVVAFKQIEKRLGQELTQKCISLVEQGLYAEAARLSLHYYDRAYLYGLSKRDPQSIIYVDGNLARENLSLFEFKLREEIKKLQTMEVVS
ncbi:MAG: tRNA 2-selenouridine(34) synthase MnmH [Leptospiraceae bacterium]|nr:tRNA 2-selenouridine(34) synthase MnmH [Leptospiraceae bacterium]MDW8306731.1 tRNA 2-selenouridine(34) synthase MnmH [Leptospiraceae bacterium]